MKEAGTNRAVRLNHRGYPRSIAFLVRKRIVPIAGRIICWNLPQFLISFRDVTGMPFTPSNHFFRNGFEYAEFAFIKQDFVLSFLTPKHFAVECMTAHIGWKETHLINADFP